MKKLSVNLLLFFLLSSILISEFISTSIDFSQDGLHALLNVFLPLIWGILSAMFLVPAFLSVKEVYFRKIVIVLCIVSNLIFGTLLKTKYSSQESPVKEDVLLNNKAVNDFHLVSDRHINVNGAGVKVEVINDFSNNDYLFFSRLSDKGRKILGKKKNAKFNIKDHGLVTIRIENNSDKDLTINKAVFLKNDLWKICRINNLNVDESAFPITIGVNNFAEITLNFTADIFEKRARRVGWNALFKLQWNLLRYTKSLNCQSDLLSSCITVRNELILYTQDKVFKRLYLNGLWQYRAEGDWEPDLQKILTNLNFKTNVGFKYFDNGSNGDATISNSDEIAASYFERVSDTTGVKIIQLAAYHAFNSLNEDDALKFFYKGDKTAITLFNNEPGAAQLLLPRMLVKPSVNFISFYPQKKFGFIMGSSSTDRMKNYKNKIGVRVWKAINLKGEELKNSYIIACDFIGQPRTNYDYQDNVYLVANVRPFGYEQKKLIIIDKKNVDIASVKK